MLEAKCEASDIFDLSNCELRSLPPIFSICRAKNIQTLILHTNLLKSLKAGGMLGDLKTLQVRLLHETKLDENIVFLTLVTSPYKYKTLL